MAEIKHPGVFIEEIPTGSHPIEGVPTSITAFIGRTWRGPLDEPVHLKSFAEYERQFGGLWRDSTVGFAVNQFFENGGTHAIVVRVATRSGDTRAKAAIVRLDEGAVFRATSPGTWGLNLQVVIDRAGLSDDKLFNLTVTEDAAARRDSAQRGGSAVTERFANLSVDPPSPQFAGTMLQQHSQLLRLESGLGAVAPPEQTATAVDGSASDGAPVGTAEVTAPDNRAARTGLYALEKADLFNLLCIPPYAPSVDLDLAKDWAPAAQYCRERRAFLIVDAPAAWTIDSAVGNAKAFHAIGGRDAALYFPRVLASDPFDGGRQVAYAPCGVVAGIISSTDAARGVWKAPAGTTRLRGVTGLSINISAAALARLDPAGMNCLYEFPDRGVLIWGARTLAVDSDWGHVNLRRFFLFIEQSIDRGTQWVALEPNSEPTWSEVVRSVQSFLTGLWRAGAVVGTKSNDAFFVKCDPSTMTQDDIQNGRLVGMIGLAMVRPAEFIILKFSQKTADASQ